MLKFIYEKGAEMAFVETRAHEEVYMKDTSAKGRTMLTVNTPETHTVQPETGQQTGQANQYKTQEHAIAELQSDMTLEKLWECVVAFQSYPFFTVTGLAFQYTLKAGRKGSLTKELLVDRRQESKTLAWSSVVLAFENAKDIEGTVKKPKALGDIRGISYIYPLLWRFGVIQVPESIEQKLKGN